MVIHKRRLSLFVMIAGIFLIFVGIWMNVNLPSSEYEIGNILASRIFNGFVALCLISSTMFGLWFIRLDDKSITYRNYFGISKKVMYAEIESYTKRGDGCIRLEKVNGKKLMLIEPAHADEVIKWIRKRKQIVKNKHKREYRIQTNVGEKILGIILTGIMIAFLVFLYALELTGFVVWGGWIFLIIAVIGCLQTFCNYFNVDAEKIVQKRYFRKSKICKFEDISRVEQYGTDPKKYLEIYVKDSKKPIMEICMLNQNAVYFEDLAKGRKWLK